MGNMFRKKKSYPIAPDGNNKIISYINKISF
jgi:hypothetical protein